MLVWLTFLPLFGVLALFFAPANDRILRALALGTTSIVALLGLVLWNSFDGAAAGMQSVTSASWFTLPGYGAGGADVPVNFSLGVDGISILMVALTALLMPLVVISSVSHVTKRLREFLIWRASRQAAKAERFHTR